VGLGRRQQGLPREICPCPAKRVLATGQEAEAEVSRGHSINRSESIGSFLHGSIADKDVRNRAAPLYKAMLCGGLRT